MHEMRGGRGYHQSEFASTLVETGAAAGSEKAYSSISIVDSFVISSLTAPGNTAAAVLVPTSHDGEE